MKLLKGKRKFVLLGVFLLFIAGIGVFASINNNQMNAQEELKDNTNTTNFEEVSKGNKTSKDEETDTNENKDEVDTEDEKAQESVEKTTYEEPIVQEEVYTDNNQTSNNSSNNNSSNNSNNSNSNTSSNNNNTNSNNDNSTDIVKPEKPTISIDKACGYMSSSEALDHAVAELGVGGGIGAQMSGFDCVSDYEWNGSSWEEVYKWDMPGYDFIADDGNTYLVMGSGYIEQY